MNTIKCRICGKEMPITFNKLGQAIKGKKFCETCREARSKILVHLGKDRKNLKKHYKHLETELKVIEELKKLIEIGKDTDERTREFLKTGKKYWEEFNLREFYHPEKKEEEDPYAKDKI